MANHKHHHCNLHSNRFDQMLIFIGFFHWNAMHVQENNPNANSAQWNNAIAGIHCTRTWIMLIWISINHLNFIFTRYWILRKTRVPKNEKMEWTSKIQSSLKFKFCKQHAHFFFRSIWKVRVLIIHQVHCFLQMDPLAKNLYEPSEQ